MGAYNKDLFGRFFAFDFGIDIFISPSTNLIVLKRDIIAIRI